MAGIVNAVNRNRTSGNSSRFPARKRVRSSVTTGDNARQPLFPQLFSAVVADEMRQQQTLTAVEKERQAARAIEPAKRATAPEAAASQVSEQLYGPLQHLIDDDEVEEIWLNSPTRIFVARNGQAELTPLILTQEQVRVLVEKLLLAAGKRIDMASPFVDGALPGGHRIHVVIPPITSSNWAINIRKHVARSRRLNDLVELNALSAEAAAVLAAAVRQGKNVLVSGATQAGKTTMLRALAGAIPAQQRVIVCEEVAELALLHRDSVAMQTRPESLEGRGEITLRRLVKESLRMRPERIIVGEVREAESLDMIIALNSGIPGMATLHANSAADALAKLCVLPLLAGPNVTGSFVTRTVAQSLDLIVHCARSESGKRYVESIRVVPGHVENGVITSTAIFERREGELVRTAAGVEFIRSLHLRSDDAALEQLRERLEQNRRNNAKYSNPDQTHSPRETQRVFTPQVLQLH